MLDYSYRMRAGVQNWTPNWTVVSGGANARSRTVSGLTNGTPYTFEVRARNATGNGGASRVTETPYGAPGKPSLSVTPRNESLDLYWTVPDNGGRPTTEYQVQWKSGNQDFDTSRQRTTTTRQDTIPDLTNDVVEYSVQVRAMNPRGWGGWSDVVAEFPRSGPPPVQSVATGRPAIDGNLAEGQTLTADTSGISDANGLTRVMFSYQWVRVDGSDERDIPGATGRTYRLVHGRRHENHQGQGQLHRR